MYVKRNKSKAWKQMILTSNSRTINKMTENGGKTVSNNS